MLAQPEFALIEYCRENQEILNSIVATLGALRLKKHLKKACLNLDVPNFQ